MISELNRDKALRGVWDEDDHAYQEPIKQSNQSEGGDCIAACCDWLAKVPPLALCVLLLVSVAVISSCVSVCLGVWRSAYVMFLNKEFYSFLPVWLGCCGGTLVVAVLLLVIATVTSDKINQQKQQQFNQQPNYNNNNNNNGCGGGACVTILNGVAVGLLVLLQSLWLLISVALGCVLITLRHWQIVNNNGGCIRLANYGLPITSGPMCDKHLKDFYKKLEDEDICLKYFIGFISATVVVPALSFYMIYMIGNLMKLGHCGVKVHQVTGYYQVNDNGRHVNNRNDSALNTGSAPPDELQGLYRSETQM